MQERSLKLFLMVFINDPANDVLSRIGMEMTPLSIPILVSLFFEKVESAGKLDLDLYSIADDRWLVTFDATKTKLLSFHLFWCLWRGITLSWQKRIIFVCLA